MEKKKIRIEEELHPLPKRLLEIRRTYYWILYQIKDYDVPTEQVISEHPILFTTKKRHSEQLSMSELQLLNWKEVSEETYNELKTLLNI